MTSDINRKRIGFEETEKVKNLFQNGVWSTFDGLEELFFEGHISSPSEGLTKFKQRLRGNALDSIDWLNSGLWL
jgi:hypothetical protein